MKYVFENGFDVEIIDDAQKALDRAEIIWDRMTESERNKVEYFKVYEIPDCDTDEIADLTDVMTKMIKDFINEK